MPGGERVVRCVKKKKCVGVLNKSNGKDDDDDTMRLVKVVAVIREGVLTFDDDNERIAEMED